MASASEGTIAGVLRASASASVVLFAIGLLTFGAVGLDVPMISLVATVLLAIPAGQLSTLCRLPPLFGMLLAGAALRNLPGGAGFAQHIDPAWSSALRSVALGVILGRAGLGLNVEAVVHLGWACARLASLPNLAEAVTVAAMAVAMIPSMMVFEWGLLLGFVLSAVSSAVVVPSLLRLQDQGWGTDQGIPSMVLAAASLDNVLSLVGFGIVLPIALPPPSATPVASEAPQSAASGASSGILHLILTGPVALLVAAVMAWLVGRGIAHVLSPSQPAAHRWSAPARSAVVIALCAGTALTGAQAGLDGAGAIAVLVFGVALAWQWSAESVAAEVVPALAGDLRAAWALSEPALFALIGASLDLSRVSPTLVGLSIAVIATGLVVRWLGAVLVTAGAPDLTRSDRAFIGISWLPKATVQAAIGGIALDRAISLGYARDSREYENAHVVLTAAIVAILLTAPAGAAAMDFAGPNLLRRAAGFVKNDENEPMQGAPAAPAASGDNDAAPAAVASFGAMAAATAVELVGASGASSIQRMEEGGGGSGQEPLKAVGRSAAQ